MTEELSIQERYAPHNACFGCGPSNPKGLRIRSFAAPDEPGVYVARWRAEQHHEAFPGMLNGGIIGALLDCHSNWTAAMTLMAAKGAERPPVTVTGDFHVKLLRPTPSDDELLMRASAVDTAGRKVVVEATLSAGGEVCATCRGTFFEVGEGHVAAERW
jgi:acyl-coenzyme A thioesterase PaaI-like protein